MSGNAVDELALLVVERWWVETANSVWLLDPDGYVRLPRSEMPRPNQRSVDGALDDGRQVAYREVFLQRDRRGVRLRIVPKRRDLTAKGVITGDILRSQPSVETMLEQVSHAEPAVSAFDVHGI